MARRDYIKFAALIVSELKLIQNSKDDVFKIRATHIIDSIRVSIADIFANDNPRFNRQRFYRACEPKGSLMKTTQMRVTQRKSPKKTLNTKRRLCSYVDQNLNNAMYSPHLRCKKLSISQGWVKSHNLRGGWLVNFCLEHQKKFDDEPKPKDEFGN